MAAANQLYFFFVTAFTPGLVLPVSAQEAIDVKGGFFSKEQINQPIAATNPNFSTVQAPTPRTNSVGQDSFAVQVPPKKAAANTSPTPVGTPEAQPEAEQEVTTPQNAAAAVDDSMAEALKVSREVSKQVRGVTGGVPTTADVEKRLEQVNDIVDKSQNSVTPKPKDNSHRF